MRIARKITLALLLCVVAVLGVNAALSVRWEIRQFEADVGHDHRVLGRVLAGSLASAYRFGGEREALAQVAAINAPGGELHVRWIRPEGERVRPDLPPEVREAVSAGREVTWISRAPGKTPLLVSYLPVSLPRGRAGALELSEPLTDQDRVIRTAITRTLGITALLLVGFALIATLLGVGIIGRPIDQLVEKARRVGQGDLGNPLSFTARDELSELAREMNKMCERIDTSRRELERESNARVTAQEQLRHADRLATVGKLASGIAHELGTPLNVVQGRARMIATGEASGPEVKSSAEAIAQQAQSMTRIIRQLLDFARRRPPNKSLTDARLVVRQTVEMLEALAAKRRVQLVAVLPETPLEVAIDGAQIQQALTNLIVNAIQAMGDGGEVRIDAGFEPRGPSGAPGRSLRLSVQDEGSGMAPEVKARIFEPFFTTKGVGEGTGLGLSVSYGLVKDHDGAIDVQSAPGLGSRFSIYLPAEEQPCQPAVVAS